MQLLECTPWRTACSPDAQHTHTHIHSREMLCAPDAVKDLMVEKEEDGQQLTHPPVVVCNVLIPTGEKPRKLLAKAHGIPELMVLRMDWCSPRRWQMRIKPWPNLEGRRCCQWQAAIIQHHSCNAQPRCMGESTACELSLVCALFDIASATKLSLA